jgi:iron complex outermembrane receptor protein
LRARLVLAALLLLCAAPVFADEPGDRGLELGDLPPLPDTVVDEQASSRVAVVAATLAGEEVVVGAAKREQSLGDVASAVTIIPGDRLRRFGYRTVAEALRGAAGLFVVDDRMTQRLGIRGLQILGDFNTRILVLIDGATLNEPWNQFVGVGLDLPVAMDDIERIEVVRGPVSTLYGTNAFFGIINIVTRGADRAPHGYGRALSSSFGTFGGAAGFAAGDVNRQLRGSVYYSHRAGETLDVNGVGHTSADGEEAMNAAVVAHYDGAFAQVRAYRKLRQLTGAPYDTAVGDTRNHNIDEMVMGEGGYSRDVGPWSLSGRLYINRYRFEDYLVNQPDSPNSGDTGDSFWLGGEARAHVALLGRQLGAAAGVELTWNDVSSHSYDEAGTIDIKIPTTFHNEGLYAELDSAPLPALTLTAGLRWDLSSLFANNLSPRAALLLHDEDRLGLKLLYAQGFRNPGPYEAFFADGMTFLGNPQLRPERIASYEAVVWGRPLPGLSLRLSGFYWNLTDIIELVDVDGGFRQSQNLATIHAKGVELEATYRDTLGFTGFAGGALSVVDRNDSTDDAENAPLWVAQAGLSSPRLWGLFHLSTELQGIGPRHTRDHMLDADAHLGWNLALYLPRWRGFDLTVGVRNVLGTREQIPAQNDYDRKGGDAPVYLLPGEGREIYAQVGFSE